MGFATSEDTFSLLFLLILFLSDILLLNI